MMQWEWEKKTKYKRAYEVKLLRVCGLFYNKVLSWFVKREENTRDESNQLESLLWK